MLVNEAQFYRLLMLMAEPGVGSQTIVRLYQQDPSLDRYFHEGRLSLPMRQKAKRPALFDIDKVFNQCRQWCQKNSARHILCLGDAGYPPLLEQLNDAPPVLFIKGQTASILSPQLAIVGTRKASFHGLQNAFSFGEASAQNGLTVTSGLALGVDARAHEGALNAAGCTVAVLAGGLEKITPRQHIPLAVRILEQGGALVSERFPWEDPQKHDFIRRNRIISGLSGGVLVVEAPHRSGAMKTASFALEQNREVYALPGDVRNPQAKGCNKLIQQGAALVDTIDELLAQFPWHMMNVERHVKNNKEVCSFQCSTEPAETKGLDGCVQEAIGWEMTPIDWVVNQTGLSIQKVNQAVASLLIAGNIKPVPGGYARIMR